MSAINFYQLDGVMPWETVCYSRASQRAMRTGCYMATMALVFDDLHILGAVISNRTPTGDLLRLWWFG